LVSLHPSSSDVQQYPEAEPDPNGLGCHGFEESAYYAVGPPPVISIRIAWLVRTTRPCCGSAANLSDTAPCTATQSLSTRFSPVARRVHSTRSRAAKEVLKQLKQLDLRGDGGTGVTAAPLRLRLALGGLTGVRRYMHKIACRPAADVVYFPGTVPSLLNLAMDSRTSSSCVAIRPLAFRFRKVPSLRLSNSLLHVACMARLLLRFAIHQSFAIYPGSPTRV